MASTLKRAGYHVHFDRIEDVYFEISGVPCFMECKRVHSQQKLGERIGLAAEQIRMRCDCSPDSRAREIVAVDISKLLNPGTHLFDAATRDALSLEAERLLESYRVLHRRFRARQASNLQESQSYISRCYSGTSSTRGSLAIRVGISACRMAELASNVDYPNFKTAVHQRVDQENKNRPYLEIWSIMHALQLDEEHHNRKSKPSAKDESGKCLTNQGRAGEGSDPFKCLPNRCISTNVPCCLGPPRPKDRV